MVCFLYVFCSTRLTLILVLPCYYKICKKFTSSKTLRRLNMLSTDFLVIGSGPGGSVTAWELKK